MTTFVVPAIQQVDKNNTLLTIPVSPNVGFGLREEAGGPADSPAEGPGAESHIYPQNHHTLTDVFPSVYTIC